MTTRGGGTGLAGGAMPQGGIVLGTERMERVRAFDPLLFEQMSRGGRPDCRGPAARARERAALPAGPRARPRTR